MQNDDKRIVLFGGRGLAGSAALKALIRRYGVSNVIAPDRSTVDLFNYDQTLKYLAANKPNYVISCAARVGGIAENARFPSSFYEENTSINLNIIRAAASLEIKDVLMLGSNCIYPKDSANPITEQTLLTGPLESSNDAYAISKISMIVHLAAYRREFGYNYFALMPSNLYGENDNFIVEKTHVLQGLMAKIEAARIAGSTHVDVWGTGRASREYLWTDDLAEGMVKLVELPGKHLDSVFGNGYPIINIGSGVEYTILELYDIICDVVGYHPSPGFDPTRPDGVLRKLLDTSRIRSITDWQPRVSIQTGITKLYRSYLGSGTRRK